MVIKKPEKKPEAKPVEKKPRKSFRTVDKFSDPELSKPARGEKK